MHTDLKVGRYYGELGVDLWDKLKWINEFEQHQVLVFTAKVFLDLVDHSYFRMFTFNFSQNLHTIEYFSFVQSKSVDI